MRKCLAILSVLCSLVSNGQQVEKIIQSGNNFYKNQKYSDAEKEYKKIPQADSLGAIAKYNLGNTLYKAGEKPDAIKAYSDLINDPRNSKMIADLYYNKGVVLSSQNKLEESIEAYENALLKNPGDNEARENLQKALLQLKKLKEFKDQNNKQQQKRSQPPPSSMNQKEASQKMKELEQKEKEIQQRMQKQTTGNSPQKDW